MGETPKVVMKAIRANEIFRVHTLCGLKESIPRRFDLPPITDGFSHHRQLAAFLDGVGFDVQRIERDERHPVWRIYLRRGDIPEGQETFAADVTLSQFLIARGEVCFQHEVKSRIAGERVSATILWCCGLPGWLSYRDGLEVLGCWNQARGQGRRRGARQQASQLRLRF